MASSDMVVSPGRLQVREGGGGISLFGLPFFAAGIAMLLISVGVIPVSNARTMPWFGWPVLVLMGLVFTAVGGALVFGRSWTTIDAMQRTVLKQWGLLVPMHQSSHRLDEFSVVRLEFKRGDSDTADAYSVHLKGRTGPDLPLFSSTQYAESRARAAAVAELLNLEIEDASTDHPVRLPASRSNLPLQSRVRLEGEGKMVARPASMRSQITSSNGSVQLVIPSSRTHPALLLVFLIPAAIPLLVLRPFSRFFEQTHTPSGIALVFQGFLLLFFVVLPVAAGLSAVLRARRGRTTITVSTRGIRIDERRVWKTRTLADLPAGDILDLDYSTTDSLLASTRDTTEQVRRSRPAMATQPTSERAERILVAIARFARGGGVVVKTRDGLTSFGRGLPDDEIRYLHFVVRQALVHGRTVS